MSFTKMMKAKYIQIKTIEDIELALKDEDFIKEFSSELLLITEKTIDPLEDDTYVYDPNQATVAGLFIKLYKYFKLILNAYEKCEYDTTILTSRPLYEAFVIMKYLILKGEESQRHYRLVSYKRRFKKLQEFEKLGGFGQVMLEKIKHAMEIDGFSKEDFEQEDNKPKGNGRKWNLDGKNFSEIHKEVEDSSTYPYVYGMLSEVIHSGWGDIRQMHLTWCEGGQAIPKMDFYANNDIRIIVPILSIMIEAIEEFLICKERKKEIMLSEEHKRINKLLQQYIFRNYEESPEEYITG